MKLKTIPARRGFDLTMSAVSRMYSRLPFCRTMLAYTLPENSRFSRVFMSLSYTPSPRT